MKVGARPVPASDSLGAAPVAPRAGRSTHILFLALEIVTLLLGVVLAFAVHAHRGPFAGEVGIEHDAQGIGWQPLDWLLQLLTTLGWPTQSLIIVGLVAAALLVLRQWLEAMAAVLAGLGGDSLGFAVNDLVRRPRPHGYGIHPMHLHLGTGSFPSGHVMHYVSFYGFLVFLAFADRWRRPLRPLMALLAAPIALIGLSRLYEGEHWLTDVLGAYLFGAFWLLLVSHLYVALRDSLRHRHARSRQPVDA